MDEQLRVVSYLVPTSNHNMMLDVTDIYTLYLI